ncbi:pyridoxamine 5'-phosphate oxidase family protein [Streptomyces sp. NPDC087901]|uniref:pyridoxamine 5'-phosphate oxidase family protein n=1 Tax=Streptomyces sp. NPDC087901 TaxID=3365818 RepID=UPI0038194BC8
MLPLNYQVQGGEVMFSTAEQSSLATVDGTAIAFEADRVDDAFSKGWSVLLVGMGIVRVLADVDTARRLREAAYSTPCAGEVCERVMVLSLRHVTGARSSPGAPGDLG